MLMIFATASRLFTATATLAIGVAASTAVFTLVNALLLKPLPYAEPGRLMAVSTRSGGVSWQDARDLAEHSASFERVAAYASRTWGFTDGAAAPPTVVLSGMVTADFFGVLRVAPLLGEPFHPRMEDRGANRQMWLTHSFWRTRFGSDAGVVGRRAALNDVDYRIAGVLPEGFRFPMRGGTPEVYIPLDSETYCCQRDGRGIDAIARRKPDTGAEAAAEELRAVSRRLAERYASTNKGVEFAATSLHTFLAGSRRGPLLLLMAAVAMLMLVAALNAGGLMLARAAARVREAAIKISLGAGWPSLVRERLAEGAMQGIAAGAAGLLGARALLSAAQGVPAIADALEGYSRAHAVELDWRVALFGLALALAASIAASLAPLLLLRRASVEAMLRSMNNASAPRVAVRARQILVMAQIAATVVLLGSGGALVRSLWNLLNVDRGFRGEQIVSAGIGIPEARYNTDEKMIAFHRDVIARLRAIPGVSAAAGGAGLPLGPMGTRILLAGDATPMRERARVDAAVASPELLSLLGIPLLSGRRFSDGDRWGAPLVALVNRAFAARFLVGRQPVGTRLRLSFYNGFTMKPWSEFEIVGVMGDTRSRSADRNPEPMVALSAHQVPMEGFVYYVRSPRPAHVLASEIRDAVWSVDRNLQAVNPVPLEQRRDQSLVERKVHLWVLGAFALMALLLAGIGLGASAAAAVAESRREIGIRSALGAAPARIAAAVLGKLAVVAALGLVLGLAGMVAASGIWRSQVYGVAPLDPVAIAAVIAVLALVIAAAGFVPAWRATRVDPVEVLRS